MNITQAAATLATILDLEEYSIESSFGTFKSVEAWVEAQQDAVNEEVRVTLADDNRSSLLAILDNGTVEFTAMYFKTKTLLAIECLRTILQNE